MLTEHINTGRSQLVEIPLASLILLTQRVDYVKDKLKHRPEIIMFGKVCHQNRAIGFFSDESIGYYYSRKLMRSQPLGGPLKDLLDQTNGIFGTKLSDGVREYSGNETLKNLKAYCYETRSEVAIVGSPGWSLATQTEIPDLQDIAKNSSFQVNPKIYLEN